MNQYLGVQSEKTDELVRTKIDSQNEQIWEQLGNDPDNYLIQAKKNLQLSEEVSYLKGIIFAKLNIGWILYHKGQTDEAIKQLIEARVISENKEEYQGCASSLIGIATVYRDAFLHEQAFHYYALALNITEVHNLPARKAKVLTAKGVAFENIGETQEALNHQIAALNIFHDLSNSGIEFSKVELLPAMVNIGYYNFRLGNYQLALDKSFDALELSKKLGISYDIALCYANIGEIYQALGDFRQAAEYNLKCVDVSKANALESSKIDGYHNLAQLYFQQKDYNNAKSYLNKLVEVSKSVNKQTYLSKAYNLLYQVEKELGNTLAALDYHERMFELEEKKFHCEIKNKIGLLSADFELQKALQEKEIYRLKHIELKNKSMELEEAHQNITNISQMGREITSLVSLEHVADIIYEKLKKLMDAPIFGIAVLDSQKELVTFRIIYDKSKNLGPFHVPFNREKTLVNECIKTGREIVIKDLASEKVSWNMLNIFTAPKESAKSVLYIPLLVQKRIIGAITVQSREIASYDQKKVEILRSLASYMAIAIDNSLKHEKLLELNDRLSKEKVDLQKANQRIRELTEKAHEAGMADIAGENIHEIGNILNSINITSETIKRQMKTHTAFELEKVVSYIEQNQETIESANNQFPELKLCRLLGYVVSLKDCIINDIEKTETQFKELMQGYDLIKKVIEAQQKLTGTNYLESCDMINLVDDLLNSQAIAISTHNIVVNKRFPEKLIIETYKYKLSYVFLNLLINAIEAVITNNGEKIIEITIEKEPDHFVLSIKDNGIGVPNEHLRAIFTHGFSTKHQNGFALHKCANFIQDMGGRIWVKSLGKEKGATFFIESPLRLT